MSAFFSACTKTAKPDQPDNKGDSKNSPEVKAEPDPREALRVKDQGQTRVAKALVAALKRGDLSSLRTMLTRHASLEVQALYGDPRDALSDAELSAWVRATNERCRLDGVLRLSESFPHPYQRTTDRGFFVELQTDNDRIGLYLEREDGTLKVDNILGQATWKGRASAPALGWANSHPSKSFASYYFASTLGVLPTTSRLSRLYNRVGEAGDSEDLSKLELSDAEKLAYLRQCSTRAFIKRIQDNPAAKRDVLTFLRLQEGHMRRHKMPVLQFDEAQPQTFEMTIHPVDANRKAFTARFDCKRVHGQWKLDSSRKVNS